MTSPSHPLTQATVVPPGDACGAGLSSRVRSDRYAGCNLDPLESHGMALAAVRPTSRVLDVGCGSGSLSAELAARKSCRVFGVEPNPDRANAAESLGLQVFCGYLSPEMVAAAGPQEFVLLMDVLEHCDDPVALLKLAKTALAPGGKIVLSLPNVAHWAVRLRLLFGKFDYTETGIMDATHLRWFTRKTLTSVLSAAGLRAEVLDVSRGLWLGEYSRRPLRWVHAGLRRRLIDRGCRWFPGLFGAQHFAVCAPV